MCIKPKMSGYTFRRSNPALFIFVSLLAWSHLLLERICSFPKIARPILERLLCPGKQTGSQKNCSLSDGWMDDLQFYVLFNNISGGLDVDNGRLYAIELCLQLRRFSHERGLNSVCYISRPAC